MPAFLKGKAQFPGLQVMQLARKRIHIERIIGLTKTLKILKSELSAYYNALGSKIMFVFAMLCNVRAFFYLFTCFVLLLIQHSFYSTFCLRMHV